MKRVYLLYCLSGLVSLGYQVAWFRIYVDWFGSTNLTFALVLCNFIGGLGVGALASRPVADRVGAMLKIDDRLRVYGVIELLVAASILLIALARLIPANAWGSFPYEQHGDMYVHTQLYQLSKLAIAALCVFVPCFFMGVTFPLLCQVFGAHGRFPSALYAWNTMGACTGVLLCAFFLLPWVGHDPTLWIMMTLNLLVGAFFLATGGAPRLEDDLRLQPDKRTRKSRRAETAALERRDAAGGRFDVLIVCAVLSGLLSGALEADMFKRIGFLGNDSPAAMSFISFWAILAIFLASWMVRVLPALRLNHIKVAFVLALAVYAAAWQFAHPIRSWLVARAYAPAIESLSHEHVQPSNVDAYFPTSLGQVLLFVSIFVFPAYLLISFLLP
ncbi:MAG: spermidine synthase family protein, partial [Planctomycetota bacterium]